MSARKVISCDVCGTEIRNGLAWSHVQISMGQTDGSSTIGVGLDVCRGCETRDAVDTTLFKLDRIARRNADVIR